jgi:TetR/AcrR family transcriptional regulator
VIVAYIDRKLELSRENPKASRLFAMEILQGAPVLGDVLRGRLKKIVDDKARVLRRWIAEGRIAPVDPYHLIFMVWATTQHYADFETQIRALLGARVDTPDHFETAKRTLEQVFLRGVARE